MKYCEANQVHRTRTVLWWTRIVPVSLCLSLLVFSGISQAGGFTSPKECQSFAGDDHLECLYGYIERQQKHNDMIGSERKAQDDLLNQIGIGLPRTDKQTAGAEENQGENVDRYDSLHAAQTPPYPSETMTPAKGSPLECRAYRGAAHLNCLYAYIEIQSSTAVKVEEQLKAQKQMLRQLRDQMERQAAARQDLQTRLAERDTVSSSSWSSYVAPIFPGYAYPGQAYPGFEYLGYGYLWYGSPVPGLSLYLGVPGYYWDRPLYGARFFGPRF
jgi:hypothetical protein